MHYINPRFTYLHWYLLNTMSLL